MINRLSGRYGWRGLWLMLLGCIWILFGVGVLLEPIAPRSWVIYEHLPPVVQAAGWWATGSVAIWQGMRGPARDDSWGHLALYLMPAVRLASFLMSWVVYVVSETLHQIGVVDVVIGYRTGWFAALIWVLVAAMLRLAAAWPNPGPPIPHPPLGALERD